MIVKQFFYILFISLFLIVGACSTVQEMPEDVISDDYEGGGKTGDSPETKGLDAKGDLSMDVLDALASESMGNVVYFDYNSDQVRDESLPLITSVAEALVANPKRKLRLEGHADERGTREYNLALGERRAQSVRELIFVHGVSNSQIDIVSYGEERPAVAGSDEESWQQNRRVELVVAP